MKLLIDLGAIKTGGGAQLALNFLDLLSESGAAGEKFVLLIPETGPLAQYPYDISRFAVHAYPDRYSQRLWFELTRLKGIYREHGITHIFTFFGAGLPHPRHIRSVVTTAYPIICYPESLFWDYAPLKTFIKNRLNNQLRRRRLRQASSILVETDVMRNRIARHVPFDAGKIHVVPPVPSRYLEAVTGDRISRQLNFLLVSGCEPHKNLWRLPEIAQELEQAGMPTFTFTLTTEKSQFLAQPHIDPAVWAKAESHFNFVGRIHPRDIQSVYETADFLVNLSDLESFSNNYMEAWKAGLPLIASDRDFARSICGASALYVEPHKPADCAAKIAGLAADASARRAMVAAGRHNLDRLGNDRQRLQRVMEIVSSGA